MGLITEKLRILIWRNGNMSKRDKQQELTRLKLLFNYRGSMDDLTISEEDRKQLVLMRFHDIRKLKIDEALYNSLNSKQKKRFERAYRWYNKKEYIKSPINTTNE